MQLTRNFKLSEFKCKCGCRNHLNYINNIQELAENLQIIRNQINAPIIINSGFRCKKHNSSIGGARFSQHLKGLAVDVRVNGVQPFIIFKIIKNMMDNKKIKSGGLKQYVTFVHYDIRGYYVGF